jgi:hypothetical protein
MRRYHCKVYFPDDNLKRLQEFTERNNLQEWSYTAHCLDNVKYRAIDTRALLEFIKGQELSAQDIFEYYIDGKRIVKACYRLQWQKELDLILVINANKEIITIYLNLAIDKHVTLNANLYARA